MSTLSILVWVQRPTLCDQARIYIILHNWIHPGEKFMTVKVDRVKEK